MSASKKTKSGAQKAKPKLSVILILGQHFSYDDGNTELTSAQMREHLLHLGLMSIDDAQSLPKVKPTVIVVPDAIYDKQGSAIKAASVGWNDQDFKLIDWKHSPVLPLSALHSLMTRADQRTQLSIARVPESVGKKYMQAKVGEIVVMNRLVYLGHVISKKRAIQLIKSVGFLVKEKPTRDADVVIGSRKAKHGMLSLAQFVHASPLHTRKLLQNAIEQTLVEIQEGQHAGGGGGGSGSESELESGAEDDRIVRKLMSSDKLEPRPSASERSFHPDYKLIL